MKLEFRVFDHLVDEAKNIRIKVFVDEQKFKEEFDDKDEGAIHVLGYLGREAIATARVIKSDEHNYIVIGRVAVLKEHRYQGIGRELMKRTEEEIVKKYGHIKIGVSSQLRAIPFYEKIGYQVQGEIYLEENYPHIRMVKKL